MDNSKIRKGTPIIRAKDQEKSIAQKKERAHKPKARASKTISQPTEKSLNKWNAGNTSQIPMYTVNILKSKEVLENNMKQLKNGDSRKNSPDLTSDDMIEFDDLSQKSKDDAINGLVDLASMENANVIPEVGYNKLFLDYINTILSAIEYALNAISEDEYREDLYSIMHEEINVARGSWDGISNENLKSQIAALCQTVDLVSAHELRPEFKHSGSVMPAYKCNQVVNLLLNDKFLNHKDKDIKIKVRNSLSYLQNNPGISEDTKSRISEALAKLESS